MDRDESLQIALEEEKNQIRQVFFNSIVTYLFLKYARSSEENMKDARLVLSGIKEGLERINNERQAGLKKLREIDPDYQKIIETIPQMSPAGKNAAFYELLHDVVREWVGLISLDNPES